MTNSPGRPLRVGLTGGIASGKSTVAAMFEARGVPVIDTDIIARRVVERGQPGLAAVVDAFGAEVLLPDGSLDRARMRQRIFEDKAARNRLNEILHPLIIAATLAAADRTKGPYQIIVVPLLAETGFQKHVDRVLVVDCAADLQRTRLVSRDNESSSAADAIMDAQSGRKERLAIADDVISNDGSLQDLETAVEKLHREYRAMGSLGTE